MMRLTKEDRIGYQLRERALQRITKHATAVVEVTKVRRVRTPAGAKKYGVPIGTPIGAAKGKKKLESVARSASRVSSQRAGRKQGVGPSRPSPKPKKAKSLLSARDRQSPPRAQVQKLTRIARRSQAKADWLVELDRDYGQPLDRAEYERHTDRAKMAMSEAQELNRIHGLGYGS